MSSIDVYIFKCIGVIESPSTYIPFHTLPEQRERRGDGPVHIAIYRLDQDIPSNEDDFDGKRGDILVGGGSGEAPAMRIAIPEAFAFYTHDDIDELVDRAIDSGQNLITEFITKAFWTMTEAYIFCEGYQKLGWEPPEDIERWLTQQVLSFLVQQYPAEYAQYLGVEPLEYINTICRVLTPDEEPYYNWKDYRK